ncbi:hypothetical protein BESB_009870 [Besnoitia besnoiti]|uniref:Uncharacterized protein n=1 Tax=Besnoitia besnoiti TaxID=94643 RepID=A0A2A9MKW2_BESBE|nr:hypothetical protein BESB_009870 [Besnoitia besnoiti]PFH38645.1 hypothetical protein BESB_009870 [Besnoitia besnoiti]
MSNLATSVFCEIHLAHFCRRLPLFLRQKAGTQLPVDGSARRSSLLEKSTKEKTCVRGAAASGVCSWEGTGGSEPAEDKRERREDGEVIRDTCWCSSSSSQANPAVSSVLPFSSPFCGSYSRGNVAAAGSCRQKRNVGGRRTRGHRGSVMHAVPASNTLEVLPRWFLPFFSSGVALHSFPTQGTGSFAGSEDNTFSRCRFSQGRSGALAGGQKRLFTADVSVSSASRKTKEAILLEGAARLGGRERDTGESRWSSTSVSAVSGFSPSPSESQVFLSSLREAPPMVDRSSFYSLEEMRKENRRGAPVNFRQYMRSLLLPFRHEASPSPAPESAERLSSLSLPRGLPPITFKKYQEGMHAAHYYPSRLLPPSHSAPLPGNVLVTPFATHFQQPLSRTSLASRAGVSSPRSRRAGKPLAASQDPNDGNTNRPQMPVLLTERCAGRLTLLFIFTDQPPHSEMKDLVKWRRDLEEHPEYSALVYPARTPPSASAVDLGSPYSQPSAAPLWPPREANRLSARHDELYQVAYLCSESCSLFLRWLCIRSMRFTAAHFAPQSERNAGGDGAPAFTLNGSAPSMWGTFLGNAKEGGRKIVEATGLAFRPEMVTTMLIDRAGLIRWHVVGAPTDEAVQFLM